MNKSMKRLVSVLLAAAVLCALCAAALADGDYTYTVRIFSGESGTFVGDQTVLVYTDLREGDRVPFNAGSVVLPDDSPYYVRGVRESGRDNNTVAATSQNSLPVQGDADYVVAYGVKGELVEYVVSYVDTAGNTLAPSETYYGNAGDKPVVAYLYIDGYEPQAYNLTRTLSDDPRNNVFEFVYSRIILPTPVPAQPSPTPYVYTEGGGTVDAGTTQIGGGAAPAGGGQAAPAPGADEAEPAPVPEEPVQEPEQEPETATIEDDQTPLDQGPAEIIDLDETPSGETPELKEKPETEMQQERAQTERKLHMAVGLLGVSLIAIAALVVLLLLKKRGARQ